MRRKITRLNDEHRVTNLKLCLTPFRPEVVAFQLLGIEYGNDEFQQG